MLKYAILLLIGFSLTSCFKDYICECEGTGGVQTHFLENRSKAEAEAECANSNDINKSKNIGGACVLKEN